jgi:transposase
MGGEVGVDGLELFTAALGMGEPWRVSEAEFAEESGRLDLHVTYRRGARFSCPEPGCGQDQCRVHDTVDKTWRHLDFFQHKAFLHARVPRVRCDEHGVRLVAVPWARPGSGFTMLFEALVLTFAKAMPMRKVAESVREHDTRVWRIVEHHVHTARAKEDFSAVCRVGMDETSAAKGQDYISVFADLDVGRVLFATPGRDAATVKEFAADLAAHRGDPAKVHTTSSDMSGAFIAGIKEHLPNAALTFDRYHLAAKLSEAVDAVRRTEIATRPELKHTRWLWLKNWSHLSTGQRRELQLLLRPSAQLATARALRWREDFQAFYQQDPSYAEEYLRSWCAGAKRSRLQPIKEFVDLVRRHWDGIIAWHHSRVSNGLLEGTNSLIQAAKARARGYRNKDKMITIAYLIAGKLPLPTVTKPAPA